MNAATRKKLLAYAIPVDLVIVATGVGLLVPGITPLAIIAIFVAAVALAAWKSGWGGAIAAMVLTALVLFALFRRSVQTEQIGWFAAASVLVSIPLAALGGQRRSRRALAEAPESHEFEPLIAAPQSIEEVAAAALMDEPQVIEREARARTEGERIAAQRFANARAKMEADFAARHEQLEREHAERFELRRAELQAAYDRERVELKAQFDAARLSLDAERAELQQQLDEERRRPAVVEKYVDEEALSQRLEHLRAELQQQFERDLQPRIDAELAAQRQAVDRNSQREIEKVNDPKSLLAKQNWTRIETPPTVVPVAEPPSRERYDVVCYNCRVVFDAAEADWCSCLTPERTVVCTNCLTCFCKATPAYNEVFWLDAPPRLFEGKAAELRRQSLAIAANVPPAEVRRPLVMLVDDDEDNQAIMQRVCANLGYGSVAATNAQDAFELARKYRPNLILADAFLPQFDAREMCRLLKEEPALDGTRIVLMTGLYADAKFKAEAVKRFRIDDYLAKPVSITDLINLLQRHLEGVLDLPAQENLYALHRKGIAGGEPQGGAYEVACFNCGDMFDAAQAEWCSCADGDNTLLCEHCGYCFCSATQYRHRFWAGAPADLLERKVVGTTRDVALSNPLPAGVRRPLVLLVEPDQAVRLMARTVTSALGYGFIVATNGEEGLPLAREYEPDLILTDALNRHLDGREMCRRAKEDPAAPPLKTIIMTGRYADLAYLDESVSRFNIDDFLAKPLAIADLLAIVRKHLPQEVQAM